MGGWAWLFAASARGRAGYPPATGWWIARRWGWARPGSVPPGTRRAAGGWMRLSCRSAFQRTVRTTGAATTKVDVPRRSLPSPLPQARSPILGGSEGRFKATAGVCLPPRCYLTRGRRARRGNGIGNASCGCPVCTVLGGATYSVVKVLLRLVGADSRGSVTISAASIRRASSAGAPIRGDVPRVPRHCPFGKRIICQGTGLKLALGVEYSTCVQDCVECLNCDSCDWDDDPRRARGARREG